MPLLTPCHATAKASEAEEYSTCATKNTSVLFGPTEVTDNFPFLHPVPLVMPWAAARHEGAHISIRLRLRPLRAQKRCLADLPSKDSAFLPLSRSIAPRTALFLLGLPAPPSTWPAKLEFASPLISAASIALKKYGLAVNAYYDGVGQAAHVGGEGLEEQYPARLLFPDNKQFIYPSFDLRSLQDPEFLRAVAYRPNHDPATQISTERSMIPKQEIFVCTHGARDCRCSDRGGPLVDALRKEIARRGLGDAVSVKEIAHVGGHKYAANAILVPSLDMLSNLTAEDAPALLSHVTTGRPLHSGLWSHWRGRYGLTEEQQLDLWARVKPETLAAPEQGTSLGPAVKLRFQTFEGEIKDVTAQMGDNLLHVGKENNLPSIEGVCGGNLECATCHLYLPSSPPLPVPDPSEEELDMLGYAIDVKEGESRLGCQINVTPELARWVEDGGIIRLPRF